MDAIEPIKHPRGRPRKRPEKLHTDKAYDDDRKCARALKERGIKRRIARKEGREQREAGPAQEVGGGTDAGVAVAKYRRPTIRNERRDDIIHEVFVLLGCSLICLSYLS